MVKNSNLLEISAHLQKKYTEKNARKIFLAPSVLQAADSSAKGGRGRNPCPDHLMLCILLAFFLISIFQSITVLKGLINELKLGDESTTC